MSNLFNAKIGIGPMSNEVIEAVFIYSQQNNSQIMLIASKNQIDYCGGYVNNWNTIKFINFINNLKLKYKNSNVLVCRDHCGPGFNNIYDLKDCYNTIKSDVENNFDLIHIDFCHIQDEDKKIKETEKAIKYCIDLNPNIKIEIGTDENTGVLQENTKRIIANINYFCNKFNNIEFYVIQTGSLIKEDRQIGKFNKKIVKDIIDNNCLVKFKEHNSDYLNLKEIKYRNNLISAMNIAPQMGVLQTDILIKLCNKYNIYINDFLNKSYNSNKWQKWILPENKKYRLLCSRISGHYVFCSDEYKILVDKLNKKIDFSNIVIKNILKILNNYNNFIPRNL